MTEVVSLHILHLDWMPSAGLQPFCLALMIKRVFGSAAAAALFLHSLRPSRRLFFFFLAWTYAVKSSVIKQLEGLLWGALVQCGRCQSDYNQDLHRPCSWWHPATSTWADARRLITVIHAFCGRTLTVCNRWGTQEPIRDLPCTFKQVPWDLGLWCLNVYPGG